MMSVSTTSLFLADVRDGEGAVEVDSSGASVKSCLGYSPSFGLGWIASGYVDNLIKHFHYLSILANKTVVEKKHSAKTKSVPR
jgi:hypothetical protein